MVLLNRSLRQVVHEPKISLIHDADANAVDSKFSTCQNQGMVSYGSTSMVDMEQN